MKTIYFVDFDNTISLIDVWDSLAERFSSEDWEQTIKDYDEHRISSHEFNLRMLGTLQGDPDEVRSFIMKIGIDPGFERFVKLARERDREIILVSDGYDFYIDIILERAGLGDLPYFSNHMEWEQDGVRWNFPHYLPDCERNMANCKCQHMRLEKNDLCRVYIGDGVSDICAAEKSDCIYAKNELRRYFEETNRPHKSFETFNDIIPLEFPK